MKHNTAKTAGILLLCTVLIFCAVFGVRPIGEALYPRDYSDYVEYYAAKYSLDPNLVYAFIRTESRFNPDANSGSVDARGLMQMTEDTFNWIKTRIAPTESIVFDDMYNPEQSIRFGCYMLAYCMLLYDDVSTVAAAYHNGINLVNNLIKDPEYSSDGKTLKVFPYRQMNIYVRNINTAYKMYTNLYKDV